MSVKRAEIFLKKWIFIVISAGFITACNDTMHGNASNNYDNLSFDNVGQQIYFTGRSSSGDPVNIIGGHHHLQMHGGGCASCHGVDREGGARMWPRFWVSAPSITNESLIGDHEGDGHGHAEYDADSLKTAIVTGINPAGKKLNDLMPRWQMSERDMDALIHYLLDNDGPHEHQD